VAVILEISIGSSLRTYEGPLNPDSEGIGSKPWVSQRYPVRDHLGKEVPPELKVFGRILRSTMEAENFVVGRGHLPIRVGE
jgi:hypothetical protein